MTPLLALGLPGFKGLLIIAVVALLLYGRSGTRLLALHPAGRMLLPWLSAIGALREPPPRQTPASGTKSRPAPTARPPVRRRRLRLFWVLTLGLTAALLAWVATRWAVHSSAHLSS